MAPFLAERRVVGALARRDGHVDAGALLSRLVGEASARGVEFRLGCEVRGIVPTAGGFHIETARGALTANVVVNGAGAWANMVGGTAGCASLPMTPRRRSLFVGRVGAIGGHEPVVWDVSEGFYARPESAGQVLLSACEEVEHEPCIPEVGEEVGEALWHKLRTVAPGLSDVQPLRSWACLRTVAMDGRMFIGWDPSCRGFLWVGGLGGHGVTTSLAVGELAADIVLGVENEFASVMAPGRVLGAQPTLKVQLPKGANS
jgi:glycine/D-amino acid oxidase-like deaminating enzyme